LALSFLTSACTYLEGEKVDYKSASSQSSAPSLVVPPDLVQLSTTGRYANSTSVSLADSVATRSGKAETGQKANATVALNPIGDTKIIREGDHRWLKVNRPPEQIWDSVHAFWLDNGFVYTRDDRLLGLLETDWAENRAKVPMDIIRSTLGSLLDSLYSTDERDRFITRIERDEDGHSLIFISHRGMLEVYSDGQKSSTTWQPRPVDPTLEAEFLGRLMVKLNPALAPNGASTADGKKASIDGAAIAGANTTTLPSKAKVVQANNLKVLELSESFDRAWRRVGLTLDRTGFTVEDRDRAKGIYFVRYVPPDPNRAEPNFFSKLFGGEKSLAPIKYQMQLIGEAGVTRLTVLNSDGKPDNSKNVDDILNVLQADLK
jgi:outer membrane protein assembly factor BamC